MANDTDVLALLLFYVKQFNAKGMEELWLLVGTSTKKRFIPVHTLAERLGEDMSRCVLKAHLGTGCDYLSKMCTKRAMLQASPDKYLLEFAEEDHLSCDEITDAEAYLVQCCRSGTVCKTFDELRLEHIKKKNSVLSLPPTSYSVVNGHITRWWFVQRLCSTLLLPTPWIGNPMHFGWELSSEGELLPVKHLNPLPETFSKRCGCKESCSTKRCSCRKNNTFCSDYCGCNSCTNIKR